MLSSPFIHAPRSTPWVMQHVVLALLPAIAASLFYFGWAQLSNLVLATLSCLMFEALALRIRGRALTPLKDLSALVTAVLIALALPPAADWWLIVTASGVAMILAKHLYGGLGFNPFNPAMVAYVVVLISFPLQMSQWIAPLQAPNLTDTLGLVFGDLAVDGYTGATALELIRHNDGLTVNQLIAQHAAMAWGSPWHLIAGCYLLGGIYLLVRKIIFWQLPAGLIGAVLLSGLFVYDGSSDSALSPLMQVFSGAVLIGAFFIITDPVSAPTTPKGRLIAGLIAGLLVVVIRHFGNYPDAVAFAVLLVNLCAPLIDYFTLPRTYGHTKAKRATDE